MASLPMTRIRLQEPGVSPHELVVEWLVEPAQPLYRQTSFRLVFPQSVALTSLPPALWWTVALVCLHSHWVLLRPCRIELPVTLGPGEREFWLRLMEVEGATLDAYRLTTEDAGSIEITESGPKVEPMPWFPDTGRCAAAFSGGKDSLLQAGLLSEITDRPILVTTTSPMPPLSDHETPRRRYVLDEIRRRRDVTMVEVISDFRQCWKNDFPSMRGYPVAVNEITDTFLYFAATLIAALALGATHTFLASESEVQETIAVGGWIIQHLHFMYSAATQRSLDALLAPAGIRYGSLTYPLHSFQVQRLLWTRYRDLRDLQYSCWQVGPDEATCSRCPQCLRLALGALALGDTPEAMGIDLVKLLNTNRDWTPEITPSGSPALPRQIVGAALRRDTVRSIAGTPLRRVFCAIFQGGPGRLRRRETWTALTAYAQMRRRAGDLTLGPAPGYRATFLDLVDALLRDRVSAIFDQHFTREQESADASGLARSLELIRWITDPLNPDAVREGQAFEP